MDRGYSEDRGIYIEDGDSTARMEEFTARIRGLGERRGAQQKLPLKGAIYYKQVPFSQVQRLIFGIAHRLYNSGYR